MPHLFLEVDHSDAAIFVSVVAFIPEATVSCELKRGDFNAKIIIYFISQ
jgi:hypothetical protein